jgi:ABC-2 type transport system permease protein
MIAAVQRLGLMRGEWAKLRAFVRRDFLVAWSYRMSFFSDLLSLVSMTVVFYFVGMLVDESKLPTYDGTRVTYIEFAVVGIALGLFMQLGLDRVARAVRNEQLMGTLESLLLTPTSSSTVQAGSVAFDLIYVPLRTAVFLLAIALAFGLHLELSGLLPAIALLIAFIPFVWGIGVASAATILTFRRGGGLIATAVLGLALLSGVYFPIDLLPGWLVGLAELNPVAIAIDGMRQALLGGAGWDGVLPSVAVLAPVALASLLLGQAAFRAALRRERRLGTLGLY